MANQTMTDRSVTTVRLILGDQLNAHHSWYQQDNDDCIYVMMELAQETDYVRHHRQKILAFFSAMRHFADALQQSGKNVHYFTLDHPDNTQSLTQNLTQLLHRYPDAKLQCQLPDEYRLDHQLRSWAGAEKVTIEWFDSEHFLTARDSLNTLFDEDSQLLMETFYRHMRRHFNILMDNDKPQGGQWNYDADNRAKLTDVNNVPQPLLFDNDVSDLNQLLLAQNVDCFGNVDAEHFGWPNSRRQARQLLTHFCQQLLPYFGRYQDAMVDNQHSDSAWSLYHSRLSFALNSKMLQPLEVVNRAIEEWQQRSDDISLNQVEGFVRQIIGWREYIRGIYWRFMPHYKRQNQLAHQRQLPDFYWTAKTRMNCMSNAIQQSLDYAYAHHIQRLMITGNFALIAGLDPDQVDAWYLGIYADAIEWVELPNTRGMSQFADGGLLATKPYAGSANYINKMSDYCGNCHYQRGRKTGEQACPFNSLYWHFIHRHEQQFKDNHRMKMMYSVWYKKDEKERQQILAQADYYLDHINQL